MELKDSEEFMVKILALNNKLLQEKHNDDFNKLVEVVGEEFKQLYVKSMLGLKNQHIYIKNQGIGFNADIAELIHKLVVK